MNSKNRTNRTSSVEIGWLEVNEELASLNWPETAQKERAKETPF